MGEFTNNDGGNKSLWGELRDFFKKPEKPKITIKPKITVYEQPSSGMTVDQAQADETRMVHPERITIKDVVYNQIEFNGRTIDWFRQKNSWDCGPCMCLNMQDLLNTKNNSNSASDVDNFRIWAERNTLLVKNRRILQNGQISTSSEKVRYTGDMDTEWLGMEDIRNYVKDCLGLKEIAIENANNVAGLILNESKNSEVFVWGVDRQRYGGNHYRGYFVEKDGKNIYDVDSYKNGLEVARIDDISNFVREAIGTCFIAVGPEKPKLNIINQQQKITILNQNR